MITLLTKNSSLFFLLGSLFMFIQINLSRIERDIHKNTSPIKQQIHRPEVRAALTESGYHKIRLKLENLDSRTVRKNSFLFKHIHNIFIICLILGILGSFTDFWSACKKAENSLDTNAS